MELALTMILAGLWGLLMAVVFPFPLSMLLGGLGGFCIGSMMTALDW